MAAIDPYIAIDAAYSDAVKVAVDAHQQAVAPSNAQLAADLSAAAGSERPALLEAFTASVAPHRQAYQAAVQAAETTRQADKTAAVSGHQTYETSLAAREANAATLRGKANTALATNATYLAQPVIPPSPTNAQLIAAVRVIRDQADALTKQNNAIIKLMLGLLDDVNGT